MWAHPAAAAAVAGEEGDRAADFVVAGRCRTLHGPAGQASSSGIMMLTDGSQ